MLPLDDPRWQELQGAYRAPYDPRPALLRLATDDRTEAAWKELWDALHHQGNVDVASYAAVPHIVRILAARNVPDWHPYALVSVIELERHRPSNPALPDWLQEGYEAAWLRLMGLALYELEGVDDPLVSRCILGALAVAKGLHARARLFLDMSDDEVLERVTQEAPPELVLEGSRMPTLDAFYDEVERVLIPGRTMGRNLDAFNDILRGGFGTPDDGFVLVLRDADELRANLGDTMFDAIVEIIQNHGPEGAESQDNVLLQLE
ncbi:MAG: barstar family protein [Planctomycetota bacterium]|nr:barstar family protein [Planctomycetota bacterium]